MGSFMYSTSRPGLGVYGGDGTGQPVATSAAVAPFHPNAPQAKDCWWGMLVTSEHRRRQGIAVILSAMSIIAMQERHGFSDFCTGIRDRNVPSENLCTKLGLSRTAEASLIAIDPSGFGEGRLTK